MNIFVHLNLASTLLAAFIVFVFGIELGNTSTVSSKKGYTTYTYGHIICIVDRYSGIANYKDIANN